MLFYYTKKEKLHYFPFLCTDSPNIKVDSAMLLDPIAISPVEKLIIAAAIKSMDDILYKLISPLLFSFIIASPCIV